MKKVLIVSSVASMIEQFNMPNINLLIKLGYKIHVACNFEEGNTCSDDQIYKLKKSLEELDVEYYQIDFKRNVMKIFDNIQAYKKVLNLMENNEYSFVHCHSPIGGVCARLAGKATNTKVIYTAHGFHFYKGAPIKYWMIFYPIEKWLSRYTDVLITINEEDFARANKHFNACKVEYIHGVGIDIKKLSKIVVDKSEKRKELGIPVDAFLVISVGELNKNKNHETIIKAIAELNNPNVYYAVCGQGSLEGYLEDLIKELSLEKQVKLLGYRRDVAEISKISDLFIFPSIREGLPVALMEAMAMGMPVIGSKIRGNIDLIKYDEDEFLCKAKDVDRFKTLLQRIIDNEELRLSMKNSNLENIKLFSLKSVLRETENIYESIYKTSEIKPSV
ncbi:MAG: glycosyltransferase family 4 protein [Peptostreptococcaceae bacterium]|nr:glycosyltransferase family 4 protein [Peptostreptococcaceae bacterium]